MFVDEGILYPRIMCLQSYLYWQYSIHENYAHEMIKIAIIYANEHCDTTFEDFEGILYQLLPEDIAVDAEVWAILKGEISTDEVLKQTNDGLWVDMWYGDKKKDVTKIDITLCYDPFEYRGNVYIGNKVVGDYCCKDRASLEKQFPQLDFRWE